MDSLRQYVIALTAACIICGIILSLSEKTKAHPLLKLLCGLFLAISALSPLTSIVIPDLSDIDLGYFEEGTEALRAGEEIAYESMVDIIKEETEAYILDKAAALNVSVNVQVTLTNGDPPIPCRVMIVGDISPYAKFRLSQILQDDLGITKENQQWKDS